MLPPAGGYRLPAGKHGRYYTRFQAKVKQIFSGYFARLLCYLPAGQSSMCNSTPPVDRRSKPCTRTKFRAKMEFELDPSATLRTRVWVLSWWNLTGFSFLDADFSDFADLSFGGFVVNKPLCSRP